MLPLIIPTSIALIVLALLFYARRRAERHQTPTREELSGICMFAVDQTVRKQRNKQKIMELLGEKGELSNVQIREILGVSRNSVTRYINQLERAGKVEQIGKVGWSVKYRLV